MKACTLCHAEKPHAEYYVADKVTGRLSSRCKLCMIATANARAQADPERHRGYARASYERNKKRNLARALQRRATDGPTVRAADRRYRESHRDHLNAYHRQWSAQHRDAQAARRRALYAADPSGRQAQNDRWRMAHPEKHRAIGRRREAAERGAEIQDFTGEQWEVRLNEFGGRCAYCLRVLQLEQDHVQPITKGGNHTYENIVPACRSCNAKKGNRPVWVMLGG